MKKSQIAMFLFLIFFPAAGAMGAYFAITELTAEEIQPSSEPVTLFHVKNETEIISEKPAVYRVKLENREGVKVDYGLKILLDGKEVKNQQIILQNNEISNQAFSIIPDLKGSYQKLEFVLSKGIEPFRTYVFQIIPSTGYGQFPKINPLSLQNKETIDNKAESSQVEKESTQSSTYTVEKNGSTNIYKFKSGERLELTVRDGIVNIGDAVYSTVSDGDSIVFIQEMYEKIYPNSLASLYLIILRTQDNKLSINETLKLKNGYSVTLREIDSQNINKETLKIDILKDNKIVREIISQANSPIEYWHQINDYKKERIIRIIPTSISSNDIMFDITQYGTKKQVFIGNRYEEFKIEDITQDSIIMKNTRPLNLEVGKVLSLIKGKIQIKV
ncbi:MAG: hypothetical protein Q7J35_18380 [Candidatus Methanoperedens sp.]|nr:hypothetical protein [Candidatus Methanoperedens sp.]